MRLVIAAGGTGGHLFPGIAVAEAWKELDRAGEIFFVGSDRNREKEILQQEGYEHHSLSVGRMMGEGLASQIRTFLTLPQSGWDAVKLLKQLRPDVILGIGGYSSGPMVSAAFLKRIPRAILEPNSIPGLTNRLLQVVSNRVFIAFPETARFFSPRKTVLTGTPVRKKLSTIGKNRSVPLDEKAFTIFILGGSQGATALNQEMVRLLPSLKKEMGSRLRVIHQTGNQECESVKQAYQKAGVVSRVEPFIEDMAPVYAEADIAVSRAGASTIAELVETGLPAILIPYPHAAEDHQRFNALSIQEVGGAEMILNRDLSTRLGPALVHYFNHRDELQTMRETLQSLRKAPAATVIAKECLLLAS